MVNTVSVTRSHDAQISLQRSIVANSEAWVYGLKLVALLAIAGCAGGWGVVSPTTGDGVNGASSPLCGGALPFARPEHMIRQDRGG